MTRILTAFALWMACPVLAGADTADDIKALFTKYEHRVPMRDGKRLFTAVYVPKDLSQTYPILLKRTPYSCKPYGVDQFPGELGPSDLFLKAGYIFAIQDVRGRWMSEGEHGYMRPHLPVKNGSQDIDESTDTYDTIEWLVQHVPANNRKVGMWGVSYPGFYVSAGMIDAHPALVACSPQAPITDWFAGDDWHHNGALILPHAFSFLASFGRPRPDPTKKFDHPFDFGTPDGYDFYLRLGPLAAANQKYFKDDVAFWKDLMAHGTYDEFWQARNLRPHLKNIRPAVMTVGGWFDAENLFGALETYKSVEAQSPQGTNVIVMGPWRHGNWTKTPGDSLGDIRFGAKTAEFYRQHIELPFFEWHLKGRGEWKQPEAWVFETGTNQWRQYDAWPPKAARQRSLYLHAAGKLSWDAPAAAAGLPPSLGAAADAGYDEYISDPAKPVPYREKVAIGMAGDYMIEDQRLAGRRTDVLVYQTDVLEEDVTLVGPLVAELHVSTTGTDSDWIVKLVDVYPDDYPDPKDNPTGVRMGGYQQLVRGDVMRGKFRNSLSKPEPFEPGQPTPVTFTLPDTCHSFRPGHRIMVQIQSTWFPLVDRNPQKFVDIYTCSASDFQKATQRVYRTGAMPSRLRVQVLP